MAQSTSTSTKPSASQAAAASRHWQLLVASAGTGKTEKIQSLVLARVLAQPTFVEESLTKMLLVSFTETAAAELRSRVHGTIAHAVEVLRGRQIWRNSLLEQAATAAQGDDAEKLGTLIAAQAAIDQLRVCTIHSFCKEILNTYPIESGIRTGLVIASDLKGVEDEAIADAYAALVHEYDSQGLWTAGFETPGGFSGNSKNPDPKAPTAARLARLARCVIDADVPLAPVIQPPLIRGGVLAQNHAAHCTIAEWFAHEVRNRFRDRKTHLGLMSLSDLVGFVDAALIDASSPLRAVLAGKWDHIILDEAQDTDAAQWRILESLSPSTFVAVGDPKQSIFSFRGAHYDSLPPLQKGGAWKPADTTSLTTNYRSDSPLLYGLNHLLGNGGLPHWQAVGHKHGCRLHRGAVDAANEQSGLYFHMSPRPATSKHTIDDTFEQVAEGILQELEEGLVVSDSDDPSSPQERFGPKHVAVLVRSNRVAEEMRKALVKRGIPVAAASKASLLDSDELRDLAAVFAAIAEPFNRRRVATAAMTRIVGFNNAQLNEMLRQGDASNDWKALVRRFADLRESLTLHAIAKVLDRIFDEPWPPSGLSARERILAEPDGERIMKNLLDIGSLLVRTLWRRYGSATPPAKIAEWLLNASARASARTLVDEEEENAYGVALETDEDAVRIMTVHVSKGRQFGSVWLPEASWTFNEKRFYDKGQPWRMASGSNIVLEVAPADAAAVRAARTSAAQDTLAEEKRLLYVAATRARHRTHMIVGCFDLAQKTTSHQPIGHFLAFADPLFEENEQARLQTTIQALQATAASAQPKGRVVIQQLPTAGNAMFSMKPGMLPADPPSLTVPAAMRLTSFSSLSGLAKCGRYDPKEDDALLLGSVTDEDAVIPKRADEEDDPDETAALGHPAAAGAAAKPLPIPIGALPGGKENGDFVHQVLEHVLLLPAPVDVTVLRDVIVPLGETFGLAVDSPIPSKLAEPLWDALNQPLGGPFGILSLLSLAEHGDLTTELPFTIALDMATTQAEPADLHDLFKAHDSGDFAGFHAIVKPLTHTDARGLLNGFMDLVWRSPQDGRIAVVDYKTNLLRLDGEATLDAYTHEELRQKLASSYYLLQAALYASVIYAWMRHLDCTWSYDNFQGVSVPFLRAMGPHAADALDNGVYHVTVPETLAKGIAEKLCISRGRTVSPAGSIT